MAKQKNGGDTADDTTTGAPAPRTALDRINDHKEKLDGLKDMKTAMKEDGSVANAKPLDLSTEEGYEAYPHKMANVTRGDLLIAMQGGSGKGGIETLTAKWDLEDHGDRFDDENAIPFAQRASQGKAQTVQGARHADVVAARTAEHEGTTHAQAPQHTTGKGGHAADKPYP